MINVAYRTFEKTGDSSWTIGTVSDAPDAQYLWHYWIPIMLLLDREKFRLCSLDEVLAERSPFLYPVELRWEFLEWLEEGIIQEFLTPHIPPAVFEAARIGRALIIIFYGNEGRLLSYTRQSDGRLCSVYDRLLDFVQNNNLPSGAVWFVNGNLNTDPEYRQWKLEREIGDATYFEVRTGEYFSYMTKMMRRLHESGYDITMHWDLVSSERGLAHYGIDIEIKPLDRPLSDVYASVSDNDYEPAKLFLCMNRITRGYRRHIVVCLQSCGLLERSLVSFNDEEPDTSWYDEPGLQRAWEEVKKKIPMVIDRTDMPSNWNLGGGKRVKVDDFFYVKTTESWPYRNCFFSIVTETQYRNDLLYPSEKIWKPIVHGLPFIVVGTPGLLSYLRSLGFQTFSPIIDEEYDSIVDDDLRLRRIYSVIERLGNLSQEQLRQAREALRPVTSHNAQHLMRMYTPLEELFAEISARLPAVADILKR
ncbi:MAG TPA: hypothetical protein VN844_29725 [Pyrinomonadaceae bacterium]|nr:hypothetical protein [Pyrinomonadaceae bacterium]